MEEKKTIEQQKELFPEPEYNLIPIEENKGGETKEGKEKGKEENNFPRISYALSSSLSHPSHGEQLELWPELKTPSKIKKGVVKATAPEPFYFTYMQHLLIRAFSDYISQHGDNESIIEFKKEIEEGTDKIFSNAIPISNTEIAKIIYGKKYRENIEGDRIFKATQTLANKWVAQKIRVYPLDVAKGKPSEKPHNFIFTAPLISIKARVQDADGNDTDISLIEFGRILMEKLDTQWIPQPRTIFSLKNSKGRKIKTELAFTLLAELETLWKGVMAIYFPHKDEEKSKRKTKAERDQETAEREKSLWRELKFSTIKETCSTRYDTSREMKQMFKEDLKEALYGYHNSLGIITNYEIQETEEKIRFKLNPYYGKKENLLKK